MVKKNPTMRDVAELAGGALGTVDRYINGTGRISEEKHEAVRKAIETLNYVPNKAASALSNKRLVNIGVIFPYMEVSFWEQIESGIDRAKKEYDTYGLRIHPIRLSHYSVEKQIEAIDELIALGVSGIAMVPMHESLLNSAIGKLSDDGISVVTFDSDAPLSRRICFVGVDDHKSGEAAARMMVMLMHEEGKIAVFRAQRDFFAVHQRIVGFGKVIAHYPNVYVTNEYDIYDGSEDFAHNLCEVIRSNFPDNDIKGILVTNGTVGTVASILKREGLAGRYTIVGFDLTGETQNHLEDGIISATICSDIEQQGYLAVRFLFEKIAWGVVPEQIYNYTKFQIMIKETL